MTFALPFLGAWLAIAAIAAIPKVHRRWPAVAVALLAGGVSLISFGLWMNDFLIHAATSVKRANAGDTYYVLAYGHYATMNGMVLLLFSAAALWLHRRAAPWVWWAARIALWLFFALVGAQVALNASLPMPPLPDPADFATRNWLASILALASFVAFVTVALCLVHTLWRTVVRRS